MYHQMLFYCFIIIPAIFALASCTSVHPVSYHPPKAPILEGVLAVNEKLQAASPIGIGKLGTSEDIAIDSAGRIYGGIFNGKIMRLTINHENSEHFDIVSDTGGRPLGMDFDNEGNLVVADVKKGLLRIDPEGNVIVLVGLAESVGGLPVGFINDVDVSKDGCIYYTDSSTKWPAEKSFYDLIESRPYGRLLRYDPQTKTSEVLLKNLYFANGVALSQNEDFVLVNEMYHYQITRYWIKGRYKGQSDIFLNNLPGFPDGISGNGSGLFWVAIYSPRSKLADWLHPKSFLKRIFAKIPKSLIPKPTPYGFVMAINEDGKIVKCLYDPKGKKVRGVTSVEEYNGYLYLGNLTGEGIFRYPLCE